MASCTETKQLQKVSFKKMVVFYQFISVVLDFLGSFAERNCVPLVDKRLK